MGEQIYKYAPLWQKWEIEELIGAGSFGRVYRASRTEFGEKDYAAVKIITIPLHPDEIRNAKSEGMDEDSLSAYFYGFVEDWLKEIRLMSSLKGNSNIVSIEDYLVEPHEDKIGWDIIIRMELLTPLKEYIEGRTITRRDIVKLGVDICNALKQCQQANIIHRDIKPENIFVSKYGNFKLGDFGVARQLEKTMSGLSKKGSYDYMAPEVHRRMAYNSSVDTYSLGIVLYRLLNNNRLPFLPAYPLPIEYEDREKSLENRIRGGIIPPPANAGEALSEVILKACAYKPKERYANAEQFEEALRGVLDKDDNTAVLNLPSIVPHAASATDNIAPHAKPENIRKAQTPSAGDERSSGQTVSLFGNSQNAKKEPADTAEKKRGGTIFLPGAKSAADDMSSAEKTPFGEQSPEAGTPEHNAAAKRSKKKRIAAAAAIIAVACAAAVFVVPPLLTDKTEMTVPNVINETLSSAQSTLGELGLDVDVEYVPNENAAKDTIIQQSPAAGSTASKGAVIVLKVSSGAASAETAEVPNVVGKTESEAKTALEGAGFAYEVITAYSSQYASGKVCEQSHTGSQSKGITVTLTVSKGKAPANSVSVPNVIGKTESEARAALENAGFKCAATTAYDSQYALGQVCKQSHTGSQNKGITVTITVSMGIETATVPTVIGKSESEAIAALQNAGFAYTIKTSYSPQYAAGKVCEQSHTGSQNKGITVTITVSMGIETATVPTVTGKSESEAIAALQNAGFNTTVNYAEGTHATMGKVTQQSKTGTQNTGTTVAITVVGKAWVSQSEYNNYYRNNGDYTATSRTQYRYRTRDKEYVYNGYPSYSGYTYLQNSKTEYKSPTYGAWQTESVSSTSTPGTTYETSISADSRTAYYYWVWNGRYDWVNQSGAGTGATLIEIYSSYGASPPLYVTTGGARAHYFDYNEKYYAVTVGDSFKEIGTVYILKRGGNYYSSTAGGGSYWHTGITVLCSWSDPASEETIYRKKTSYYQYTHWRWGAWTSYSNWSFTNDANGGDDVEIQTQSVFYVSHN